MWLFGYDTLMYRVNFDYEQKLLGRIKGYTRKFYQISIYSRGDEKTPGRMLTLVPSKYEAVWGVAYEIRESSIEKVLAALKPYEHDGYQKALVTFFPLKESPEKRRFTKEELLKRMDIENLIKVSTSDDESISKDEGKGPPYKHHKFKKPDMDDYHPRYSMQKRSSSFQKKDNKGYVSLKSSTDFLTQGHCYNPSSISFLGATRQLPPPKLSDSASFLKKCARTSVFDSAGIMQTPRISKYWTKELNEHPSQYNKINDQGATAKEELNEDSLIAFTYIGTPANYYYSYETDEDVIAEQIFLAKGVDGRNADYLFQIANNLKKLYPKLNEEHVYNVEHKVLRIQNDKRRSKVPANSTSN